VAGMGGKRTLGLHVKRMLHGRDWYAVAGASPEAIQELLNAAPNELPASYLELLSVSNGGEGPLPVNPFNLCLDSAQEVAARLASGHAKADGFMIFGSNGSGEYLAFDTRRGAPWPVVTIDMVVGSASAEVVATDFDAFIDLIGVEPPDA
jgi:hypothetical protein